MYDFRQMPYAGPTYGQQGVPQQFPGGPSMYPQQETMPQQYYGQPAQYGGTEPYAGHPYDGTSLEQRLYDHERRIARLERRVARLQRYLDAQGGAPGGQMTRASQSPSTLTE